MKAASWIRESTTGQMDNYGPDAQRAAIVRAIDAQGWTDTGIEYLVAHSGLSVHKTPLWADMLAGAGCDWDVLVVGRTNRLARRVRSQIEAVEAIRAAGGDVYFAREDLLMSKARDWKAWMDEAVAAEAYSRSLSTDVTEGIETKVRRRGIPWGRAPFGYTPDWQIDPLPAAKVRSLFEEYARGNTSQEALAETHGLKPELVREILKNVHYTGVATLRGEALPGHFPAIIDAETFNRVRETAAARAKAGGPPTSEPSMLQGRLWCACGTPVRMDGRDGAGQPRMRHPNPCEAWGTHERRQARYYTEPLIEALRTIQLTPEGIEVLLSNAPDSAPIPTSINWAAQRRALREHVDTGQIDAPTYLAQMEQIEENRRLEADDARRAPKLSPERLREILNDFTAMIDSARGQPDESEVWANVVARYFTRIEHLGPDLIRPVASDEGTAAIISSTLPRQVVLACPRGLEPPTFRSAT